MISPVTDPCRLSVPRHGSRQGNQIIRTAIFIRAYWKDLDWLGYCIQSIQLYCEGFSETVVAMPESSRPWLGRVPLLAEVRVIHVPDYKDDYLGQQVTKLFADTYTDAEYIAHVDADCIFMRAVSPKDLHPGGIPILVTKPVSELGRHYPWRRPTEDFLGIRTTMDFMQQPPFVYPRWLYPVVREHCLQRHHVPIEAYVMSRSPRGFSEFNALGAYAWHYHRDYFAFRDVDSEAAQPPCCDWHWSWGGLTPAVRAAIVARLAVTTSRDRAG